MGITGEGIATVIADEIILLLLLVWFLIWLHVLLFRLFVEPKPSC